MTEGIVDIHGKSYKTVALRVTEFREQFPTKDGWGISTSIEAVDDAVVIMKATITDPDGRVVATGHAEEVRTQKGINATSALENGETSAIGRALAAAGFAGTEYASADEVQRAIQGQNTGQTRSGTRTVKGKKPYLLDINDTIDFGKHSGRTVKWLLENELGYCGWLEDKSMEKDSNLVLGSEFLAAMREPSEEI